MPNSQNFALQLFTKTSFSVSARYWNTTCSEMDNCLFKRRKEKIKCCKMNMKIYFFIDFSHIHWV